MVPNRATHHNYSSISKSGYRLSQIHFYRGFFKNKKGLGTTSLATFFDKNLSFVVLHKMAKFHCPSKLTSKVIQ